MVIEQGVLLSVDLDKALIRTRVRWEIAILLMRRPITAAKALWILLSRGECALRGFMSRSVGIDPASLPYRDDLVEFAKEQREAGRRLVLLSGPYLAVAQSIADHLGLFDQVIATDGKTGSSGSKKLAALEASVGKQPFDYIGSSEEDLPIFAAAREAFLVEPSRRLLSEASANGNVSRVFADDRWNFRFVVKTLRLHQWFKNILLAVPLVTAHLIWSVEAWARVGVAFVAFGFVASATYLVNDLVDLQADRIHPKKRYRPLASGRLTIPAGILLATAAALAGFGLSAVIQPKAFTVYLMVYVALTLAYSFTLKRRLIVDVLTLAFLYTLRILAGGAATSVHVSEWLLMFSMFIFFSLAFLKREIEFKDVQGSAPLPGRGYSVLDLETLRIVGVASGLMSVLVLSLYINSPAVAQLYESPKTLWLMCPLLILWITRIWFLAARGQVNHDPVVFAIFDWRSYVLGLCAVGVGISAKIGLLNFQW